MRDLLKERLVFSLQKLRFPAVAGILRHNCTNDSTSTSSMSSKGLGFKVEGFLDKVQVVLIPTNLSNLTPTPKTLNPQP